MSKETKAERAVRQDAELTTFCNVLRKAGNIVNEEVRFHPERKWRFDIAMPTCEVHLGTSGTVSMSATQPTAIEVEGFGRHQSMSGFTGDLEKYGEAYALGWNVLRVSRAMIADGTALDLLARRGVNVANARRKTIPVEP